MSAVPRFSDAKRTARKVREVPCVDGSELARRIFTARRWSVQPCVRPVSAAHRAAGHSALRGSGPGQKHAFDNALAHVGCPDRRKLPAEASRVRRAEFAWSHAQASTRPIPGRAIFQSNEDRFAGTSSVTAFPPNGHGVSDFAPRSGFARGQLIVSIEIRPQTPCTTFVKPGKRAGRSAAVECGPRERNHLLGDGHTAVLRARPRSRSSIAGLRDHRTCDIRRRGYRPVGTDKLRGLRIRVYP